MTAASQADIMPQIGLRLDGTLAAYSVSHEEMAPLLTWLSA